LLGHNVPLELYCSNLSALCLFDFGRRRGFRPFADDQQDSSAHFQKRPDCSTSSRCDPTLGNLEVILNLATWNSAVYCAQVAYNTLIVALR